MQKFNTWNLPKQLTFHNFWLPFLLFGIILNATTFGITSYYENEVWDRSLIYSYLVYCFMFGVLHFYIYKKPGGFLTGTIIAFTTGLLFAFVYFLPFTLGWAEDKLFIYTTIGLLYTMTTVVFLRILFNTSFSGRFFTEIIFFVIICFTINSQLDGISQHYYGFQFILSAWLFNTTYMALVHSKSEMEGTKDETSLPKG